MKLPHRTNEWYILYLMSYLDGHNTMAIRRSDGYCLRFTGDEDRAIRREYAGFRWLQEYAGLGDVPQLLEWLEADDEEHPITWQSGFDGKPLRVAMSKINCGDVAICVFHCKESDEALFDVSALKLPSLDWVDEMGRVFRPIEKPEP